MWKPNTKYRVKKGFDNPYTILIDATGELATVIKVSKDAGFSLGYKTGVSLFFSPTFEEDKPKVNHLTEWL